MFLTSDTKMRLIQCYVNQAECQIQSQLYKISLTCIEKNKGNILKYQLGG